MDYTPITTADALQAVLGGAWLYRAEIPDLRDLLVELQENGRIAPAQIELRCVACLITRCQSINVSLGLKVDLSDHAGSHSRTTLDPNVFQCPVHFDLTAFAEDLCLDGVIFRDKASFLVTRFLGRASFDRAVFEQTTEFDKSAFTLRPAFGAARFVGKVSFVLAHFTKGADFSHAIFGQDTNFNYAQFEDSALFQSGSFNSDAQFRGTAFKDDVDFFFRQFRGTVQFNGARLDGDMHFYEADLSRARELSFRSVRLNGSIHLENTRLRGSVELNVDHLTRGPSSTIDLNISQFRECKGTLVCGETSTKAENRAAAARQYNMLRDNFRGMPGKDDEEDWCHYRYMDLKRRARTVPDLSGRHWLKKSARYSWHWAGRLCDWLFLKWCYGYGVYSKRIVVTMLAVILFFAAVYWCFGDASTIRNHGDAFNPLYFSIITFTTIGYGDYAPLGSLRWAAGFEGMLGLFLMAIFTVSFARKIIR